MQIPADSLHRALGAPWSITTVVPAPVDIRPRLPGPVDRVLPRSARSGPPPPHAWLRPSPSRPSADRIQIVPRTRYLLGTGPSVASGVVPLAPPVDVRHGVSGLLVVRVHAMAPLPAGVSVSVKALEVDLTKDDPSIEFSAGTFAAATFVGGAPSLELSSFVVDSPRLSVQLLTATKLATPAGSTIDVTLSVDLIVRRR